MGSTLVQIARGSGIRVSNKRPIEDEYLDQRFSLGRRREIDSYTRSLLQNGFLGANKCLGVSYSGERQTYTMTLVDGKKLTATFDHKILTTDGWVELGNLRERHEVMVDIGIPRKDKLKGKLNYLLTQGLRFHPYAQQNFSHRVHGWSKGPEGYRFRVATHRLVFEANLNGLSLDEFVEICRRDAKRASRLKFLDPKVFAIHHIDENHKNNHLDNLEKLSHSEHTLAHDPIQHLRHQVRGVRFAHTERAAVERTYDLSCEAPNHNFVANGIVIHNSGKSALYHTVFALLGGGDPSFRMAVLVADRSLQAQLYADFAPMGMRDIRGHKHYACAVLAAEEKERRKRDRGSIAKDTSYAFLGAEPDEEVDCARCTESQLREIRGGYPDPILLPYAGMSRSAELSCVHEMKLAEAASASIVVTNFSKWFTSADRLGEFDLLVVDEAHSVVDKIVEAVAVKVNWRGLGELLRRDVVRVETGSGIEAWARWARGWALPAARETRAQLLPRAGTKRAEMHPEMRKRLSRVERLIAGLQRLIDGIDRSLWVVAEESYFGATMSPVFAAPYAEEYLFRGIDKVILSSATPPDAGELGIDPATLETVELDSIFSLRRRPFIFLSQSPYMRWDTSSAEKTSQVALMDQCLEAGRLDRKGIYHTHSYDRARDILARSRYARYMTLDRETFETAPPDAPCYWLTPIAEEGVDLPGAQCRFAFIPKIPFLRTVDNPVQTARAAADPGDRKALIPGYVDRIAARKVEQEYGRVMRYEADWGEAIVFDGNWKRLWKMQKEPRKGWSEADKAKARLFHRWFEKAWRTEWGTIPRAIKF